MFSPSEKCILDYLKLGFRCTRRLQLLHHPSLEFGPCETCIILALYNIFTCLWAQFNILHIVLEQTQPGLMDIKYTWIYNWHGKICRQFRLLIWTSFIHQFGYQAKGRGWDKRGGNGVSFLASCDYHFIRLHENLIQHPYDPYSLPFKVRTSRQRSCN